MSEPLHFLFCKSIFTNVAFCQSFPWILMCPLFLSNFHFAKFACKEEGHTHCNKVEKRAILTYARTFYKMNAHERILKSIMCLCIHGKISYLSCDYFTRKEWSNRTKIDKVKTFIWKIKIQMFNEPKTSIKCAINESIHLNFHLDNVHETKKSFKCVIFENIQFQ